MARNSLTLLTELDNRRRERILIYSAPGIGKTRFGTSLPEEKYGNIAYIALDRGSEYLDSVLDKYRSRIHVIKPTGDDPQVTAAEIAVADYPKLLNDPNVKTIVIDTFTQLTLDILAHVANTNQFGGNHVIIGPPGSPLKQALPTPGDYGGVHANIRNFIDALFEKQKDMHIILICHEGLDVPDEKGAGTIGGPATVGRALLRELASNFNTVVRLERKPRVVQGKDGKNVTTSVVVARSDAHGYWTARIREGGDKGNPMATRELGIDPKQWWEEHEELFNKETK